MYTVEQLTCHDKFKEDRELVEFCYLGGVRLSAAHPQFSWEFFPMRWYIENNRVMLCRRDGKPVGMHFSRKTYSVLDTRVTLAVQDLLYTLPNTRAAKLLMDDFIDFGKREANHIITMIGEYTNIKDRSLQKLGFTPFETLYRMEIT